VRPWTLEGFLERLDAWAELESPKNDLLLIVTAWVMTRYDDPYQGIRRKNGFPNLWFGAIPNSGDVLIMDQGVQPGLCAAIVSPR